MPDNQTFCHQFKADFEKLTQTLPALETLFQDFISTGTVENLQKLRESLSQATQAREQLVKEYQQKARELLREWYPKPDVDDFMDKISFEDSGRVVIEGDLNLRYRSLDYFPSLIRIVTGALDLRSNNFTQIDYLEEVEGSLSVFKVLDLSSMKSLRKVGGYLDILGTSLTALDALEKVGRSLNAPNLKTLSSMRSLRKVGKWLAINGTSISSLPSLEEVEGYLDVYNLQKPLSSMEKLKRIRFSLNLVNTPIDAADFSQVFASLKKVGEDLNGVSIYLSKDQGGLRQQIEALKAQGRLSYDGGIELS
jgi:hypothetical protein